MIRNTTTTYGVVAKSFHWIIALLIIAMLIYGFFLEDIPKDYQPMAYNIHKLTGITILFLMILRGCWALINTKPSLPFGTKPWEEFAEKLVHRLLYLFVFAMPIAGWVGSTAAGHSPHIGGTDLNLPIEQNKTLADISFETHNTIAIILIVFVSIHVLAALFHHFIKRDDVLRRMI